MTCCSKGVVVVVETSTWNDDACVAFVADNDPLAKQYLNVGSDGRVYLLQSIDPSFSYSNFTLNVIATDDGSCCDPALAVQRQSSAASVSVIFVGVNTQPTFPDCHFYRPAVLEGQPANTVVLLVRRSVGFLASKRRAFLGQSTVKGRRLNTSWCSFAVHPSSSDGGRR
jgi:hypothetical protein